VFQFTSSGESPKAEKPKADAGKDGSSSAGTGIPVTTPTGTFVMNTPEVPEALKSFYKDPLPQRDPFDRTGVALMATQPTPVQPDTYKPPTPKPPKGSSKPIKPFDPSGGGLFPPPTGSLPPVTGNVPPNGGGAQIVPGAPLRLPGEFSYTLCGVILGRKPAAVFTDSSGNQRLVQAGGSIDGDSQVISVTQNKVVLRHNGKTLTLTVGGNSDAK
jgi:hypothetical protein